MSCAVGGSTSSTKIKIAFSGASLIRFRITYTNWPTVKSYEDSDLSIETGHDDMERAHRWYKVLLLVDCRNVCPVCFLADDLQNDGRTLAQCPIG